MGSKVDPTGTLLLTDDGDVIAIDRGSASYARAIACVGGAVVNLGLGWGTLRQGLLGEIGKSVISVRTVEESSEVNEAYGVNFYGDKDNPEVESIAETVAAGDGSWDSVVFDLVKSDLFDDTRFLDDLRTIFSKPGGRVVIISDRGDIEIPGFSNSGPERFGGQFVYILDRFDPFSSIGQIESMGAVYDPGYGWIAAYSVASSSGSSTASGLSGATAQVDATATGSSEVTGYWKIELTTGGSSGTASVDGVSGALAGSLAEAAGTSESTAEGDLG